MTSVVASSPRVAMVPGHGSAPRLAAAVSVRYPFTSALKAT